MGVAIHGWGTADGHPVAATGPALAVHPRPVGGAGQRSHGPADPAGPGGSGLPALPGPLPDARPSARRPRSAQVLRAWKGLGYNRRARDLHRAAEVIVPEHGGPGPGRVSPPCLALPGVGAYTARAVMAFAFEADVGVVDTNAGRVLSRAVAGRPLGRARGPAAGGCHGAGREGAGRSDRPCSTWAPRSVWPATRAAAGARSGRGAGGRRAVGAGPDPARRLGRRCPPPRAASTDPTGRAGGGWSTPCATVRSRPAGPSPRPGGRTIPTGPTASSTGLVADGLVVRDRTGTLRLP